jgi:hypothetical protein
MDWEKIKHGSWGAVVGSLVTMYVGFNVGGWMTSGSAEVWRRRPLPLRWPSVWDT